jgi:hypothetical protein
VNNVLYLCYAIARCESVKQKTVMNNNKVAVLSDALFAIANVATVYGTNSKDTILKNEIHKAIKKAIEIIDNGSTSFVSDEFLMKSNREWLKKFDQDFEIDTMKEQGDLFYPQGTDKLPDNVNFWESLYEKEEDEYQQSLDYDLRKEELQYEWR